MTLRRLTSHFLLHLVLAAASGLLSPEALATFSGQSSAQFRKGTADQDGALVLRRGARMRKYLLDSGL